MYDRDNPPRLPASAFKPGDRVVGTDEGGTHHGTVSDRFAERHARDGDVLVWFDGESYEPGSLGNLVAAGLLQLWPAALHKARLVEAGVIEAPADPLAPLFGVPFTFGLSQAVRTIIARRRAAGEGWDSIARLVCWEPTTLERYYRRTDLLVTALNPFSDLGFTAQAIVAQQGAPA